MKQEIVVIMLFIVAIFGIIAAALVVSVADMNNQDECRNRGGVVVLAESGSGWTCDRR